MYPDNLKIEPVSWGVCKLWPESEPQSKLKALCKEKVLHYIDVKLKIREQVTNRIIIKPGQSGGPYFCVSLEICFGKALTLQNTQRTDLLRLTGKVVTKA